VERVVIIELFSCTRQGDPLEGLLFTLAHYQGFLKTIVWAPCYIFPSLANYTHIMGHMSEITHTFDHLLTQLTLVRLRVKVLKCKFWSLSKIFLGIEIF
jgi:hypothetical protein